MQSTIASVRSWHKAALNSVHTVRGQDGCSCRKMMRSVLWLIRRQDDLSTQSNNQHLFLPKDNNTPFATIRHLLCSSCNNPSSFLLRSEKVSSGSDSAPPARSGPETQDVAVFPAVSDHICCAPPLPRDRPLTTLKGRCGYSVCVVHFRKLWNNIKVGSGQSGRQVI